jgi:hypothetical protein
MATIEPTWRTFQSVTCSAEAAAFSENCSFSLATLEIDCPPGATCFALTEQEHPDVWRWAVVDSAGRVVDHGCEPTQGIAKTVSASALALFGLR